MPVGPVLFNSCTSLVLLGNPLCRYLLVQYKLACFVLFIPLFINSDTRHLGGRPTLLLAAMTHLLHLSSRSSPPPGSTLPITHVNLVAFASGGSRRESITILSALFCTDSILSDRYIVRNVLPHLHCIF